MDKIPGFRKKHVTFETNCPGAQTKLSISKGKIQLQAHENSLAGRARAIYDKRIAEPLGLETKSVNITITKRDAKTFINETLEMLGLLLELCILEAKKLGIQPWMMVVGAVIALLTLYCLW